MRRWSALVGLMMAALLMLAGQPVRAQSPATGEVAGMVTSQGGEPLREVLVTLTEVASGVQRSSFTTRFGTYTFPLLPPGEYELFIERIGYAPRRITGLPVRPGAVLQPRSELTPVTTAPETEIEPFEGVALAGARPGSQWLRSAEVRRLGTRHGALELARLATVTDETLAIEGLAPRLSSLFVDGIPFRPVAEPGASSSRFLMTAVPVLAIGAGEVLAGGGVDTEWDGVAGGYLSLYQRSGSPATGGEVAGFWGGSALPAPTGIERGSTTFNDLQGGVLLRGPLLSDSARFTIGVEARRQETLLAPAWPSTEAAAAVAAAGAQAGLDLEPYRRAGVGKADAVSAFGRLDWAAAERHRVDLAMHFAAMPTHTSVAANGLLRDMEGTDLLAGIGLRSAFQGGSLNDLRLTLTTSRRQAGGPVDVAPTFLAAENLAFGSRAAPFDAQETVVRLQEALHLRTGSHRIKLGAGLSFGSYRYEYRSGADGEYYFGSVAELQAGQGVLLRREGPAAAADWTSPLVSLFAQDQWSSPGGVDLLIGVRADFEQLPENRVRRDNQWMQLTGIANDVAAGAGWRISPRGSLTWDVNRERQWVLHAGAGVYFDRIDPLALAEWQIEDGTGLARRAAGLIAWPPVVAQGGVTATTLTLLGGEFVAPQTSRVDAGIMRNLGVATAVGISGSARRTENLVRRTDSNLQALPSMRDQHGRAVYGRPAQFGSLVSPQPESGRRFSGYDQVTTLLSDAWSEYWGVTLSAEHSLSDQFDISARYTYSQTTDNWFDGRNGGLSMTRPQGLDEAAEWAQGPSDFDVPHRAVVSAAVNGPAGLRLAALYRMQSGLPFTPGFRPGVDMSGDGQAGNDPAFVDPAIPGLPEVTARWSCLQQSAGRFAGRNSCRAEAVHTVDLTAGVTLFRVGEANAEFMVEAFDLLEAESAVPDAALYLVDPAGQLTFSADGNRVTVPLMVNPSFGEPLARRQPGRRIRLGFSLKW